jgi:hypothetical protein
MSIDLLDPPAPTMPERELTRRRAHLLREIERAPATQPHSSLHGGGRSALFGRDVLLGAMGRKAALAVVVVALIAVLAAVLPGRLGRNQMTLVDQAIAAIGSDPMIHVVLDEGRNTQLVDLRTGKTILLRSRVEVWSDPKLGALWVSTLDGKPTQRLVAPASKTAPVFAAWRPFVTGYAAQLRSGSFHLVGTGEIAGQPVDWIASKPITMGALGEEVMEIAISRATYKPLYMRERIDGAIKPGSGVRVITAETLPRQPALFAHRTVLFGPGLGVASGGGTGIPTTLRDARVAMNPDPVVPPARLAGLRRTWVGLPDYLAPPANSYRDQIDGVQLYYGHLDYTGHPTYQGSYISITEFPHRNVIVTFNGVSLFRPDAAILTTHTDTIATMKTHGLYVIIQAGSRAEALAAARALAHERG